MSLWEFAAVIGGVSKFHGGGDDRLNREEAESLGDLVLRQGKPAAAANQA